MEIAQIDLFDMQEQYELYLKSKEKEVKKEEEQNVIIIDLF